MKSLILTSWLICLPAFGTVTAPDNSLTPGVLCSASDPNFSNYDYPEHVARCKRNIGMPEKDEVAKNYGGIPSSHYSSYEFDHLIPLCAGGSDDIQNLWPQPITQAHLKDGLENSICLQMRAGTMTQAQAVATVHQWFLNNVITNVQAIDEMITPVPGRVKCTASGFEKIEFTVVSDTVIDHASIAVTSADGDHEAVRADGQVIGMAIKAKSPLLKGLVRYGLTDKSSRDRFEFFLPDALTTLKGPFKGFLKIGFDGNFPTLSAMNCAP